MIISDTLQNAGQGTPAAAAGQVQTFIIVRDFEPGQIVRVAFITTEQAKSLPILPADALQIAVAPAGGL